MDWHERLTQARTAKELKKSAFARLVGVSAPTVTDWENGDTKMIEGRNLMKVCEVLEITPEWLMGGTDVARQAEKPKDGPPQMMLQWVTMEECELLSLARGTDDEGRQSILDTARIVPKVSFVGIANNKS